MKIIEIIVSPQGETHLETKDFTGASCQDASRFIVSALGEKSSDQPTAERYQVSAGQEQDHAPPPHQTDHEPLRWLRSTRCGRGRRFIPCLRLAGNYPCCSLLH